MRVSCCLGVLFCFRRIRNSVLKLVWCLLLPTTLATILICDFCVHASVRVGLLSGYESGSELLVRLLPTLGPGFHYALLGILLCSMFVFFLAFRGASLPLTVAASTQLPPRESRIWNRLLIFLWIILSLFPTIHNFFPFLNEVYFFVASRLSSESAILAICIEFLAADAVLVVVAILLLGRQGWRDVRYSLRLPSLLALSLAISFAVGIAAFIYVGQILVHIFDAVADPSQQISLHVMSRFFVVPPAAVFGLLLPAFAEEIIYRGILQPHFVERYGLLRGIILVGIVFAFWHLHADFSVGLGFTDSLVIVKFVLRLLSSISLAFITGWLTIRSGSILPGAVTHGLFNLLGFGPMGSAFAGVGPVTYLLWALLAYSLFRYWPTEESVGQQRVLEA